MKMIMKANGAFRDSTPEEIVKVLAEAGLSDMEIADRIQEIKGVPWTGRAVAALRKGLRL